MLDDKRTSLSKLKLAYDLNELEVEKIIYELWPNNKVFPYALWETAYNRHWKIAIPHNINLLPDTNQKMASLPEFDPQEFELPLLHIYCDRIDTFFINIAAIIFVIALKNGLEDLCILTYEEKNKELQDDLGNFFDGLSELESFHNHGINRPFRWGQPLTSEQFKGLSDDKYSFIAGNPLCIHKIFKDAIVLDKIAAIRYLDKCGYSLKREVKGISKPLVECLTKAMLASPLEETPAPSMDASTPVESEPSATPLAAYAEPSNLPEDTPAEPSATKTHIVIPRDLWEGKSSEYVFETMKAKRYDDSIIAFVLCNRCTKTSKEEMGKWFSDGRKLSPSAYRSRIRKLLEEADTLYNITFE